MASGERRLGTSRRGMTVLGKIPMPSVPKPINLPSQRSENRGLDSNVEIVPRGTFSWGNAGINNAVGANKAGACGIISLSPASSGAWNCGIKNLSSGNDMVSLSESNSQPSSSGSATRPLSASAIATTTAWGNCAKAQAHGQLQSSSFTVVPIESGIPGSEESLLQHNEFFFNRPTAADETVKDLELHPHAGVSANVKDLELHPHAGVSAGSGHVLCPEGLQNPGYDHRTFVGKGMPPAGTELPVGVAPYSGSLPHEVCFQSIGIPHYSGLHNRDMVLVSMVNNPSLYESHQPGLTPVACFDQSGVHGNYRPQTRNIVQFATSGNHAAAGRSGVTDVTRLVTSGNKFERGGARDSVPDLRKYRDGQLGTVPRNQGYFGLQRDADTYSDMASMPVQGNEWNQTIPGSFRSHNHLNEAVDFVKQEVAPFEKGVPEKKIILLTKTPKVEAQKTENSVNYTTLLPGCDQGSDSCGQELGLSKFEAKNQSSHNGFLSKVKGIKNFDEGFQTKKVDGCEVKGFTKENKNLRIANQNINCVKAKLSEVETRINESWSAGIPSSTLTLTNSDDNVKNGETELQSKHDVKAAAEGRSKSARQTSKLGIQGSLQPVGVDGQPVCNLSAKQIVVADDVAHREQKLKTKSLNHKTEKAWRPKSPVLYSVVAADASMFQAVRVERISEKSCGKSTDRGELSQGCNTGDGVILEASTLLQKKKARKWRNKHCLSHSVSSGIGSNAEACSLSTTFNDQQSAIFRCTIDRVTECKDEEDTCSSQGLTTEGLNFMETDDLSQNKAKGRPSYHEAEKKWLPKSPAVEDIASTYGVLQNQAMETNSSSLPVSDNNLMKSNHELNIVEQEGLQALDTYDYEGQRARLKEIAAQRAKQRRKEEEERAREQKAKALAKLEELDRRTMSNSTSTEVNEHTTAVLEAPDRKAKKRLASSRRPSTVVSLQILERQHVDEALIQDSASALPMMDNKEVANNEETVSYNSRNERDGFYRSSEVMDDHEVHELVSGSQGQQRRISRNSWMDEEGLQSVQDTGGDSCSGEKYQEKKDEQAAIVGRPRRHRHGSHNQVRQVASKHGNESKSVVHEVKEREVPNLSPKLSEFDKVRNESEITDRGWSQQINAEEIRKPHVAELLLSEEESLAFYIPEKIGGLHLTSTHGGHSHESAGESLQEHGGKMETKFTVEQVQSFETTQLEDPIAGYNMDSLSEKVGKLHVSWRQKNLWVHPFQPNSDKSNSSVKNDRHRGVEVSSNAPTLSRKPRKLKNGGKQLSYGQHGLKELEGCVIDERFTAAPGPADNEFTKLNATFDLKHEAEMNVFEHVKDGVSRNSWWRQKNGKTGDHANIKDSAHVGAADEACEEISDSVAPYTHSSSQTSYPHNPRNNVKHSLKAAFGMSRWHKSHSMKPACDSVPLHEQQAGSQGALEENTLVSASSHWDRSSIQCGNNEQEVKILSANHPRKRGIRPHTEAKLPAGTTDYKHQEIHSMEVATIVSDIPISGKNKLNYLNSESCRTNRLHQVAFQALSPHDRHHEGESEHRAEQRPFNRGNGGRRPSCRNNKPASQRQFNGCSTAVELDRRDGETAIKTGISY